jgi:hypothetical protein
MVALREFIKDTNGDAVVEAAVVFPIIILIFAALVLLAIYLPVQAALQRATQYAATAIATEKSDTWLFYEEEDMSFLWESKKNNLKNVYVALFSSGAAAADNGEDIVTGIEGKSLSFKAGELTVNSYVANMLIYKEVVVTAKREFKVPVNLSFIRFPETIVITATSSAVVQNGDEFVRNTDLAVDFAKYIMEKFHLTNIKDSISKFGKQVSKILGW